MGHASPGPDEKSWLSISSDLMQGFISYNDPSGALGGLPNADVTAARFVEAGRFHESII